MKLDELFCSPERGESCIPTLLMSLENHDNFKRAAFLQEGYMKTDIKAKSE